jgi:hypothetical protein
MPRIEDIKFGSIKIDGKNYSQVLIIGDKVIERESERLHQLFGTSHVIGEWEQAELLKGSPEIILIADGFQGALEVGPAVLANLKKSGAEILLLHSPIAVQKYNELIKQGKKVNALIHTTC